MLQLRSVQPPMSRDYQPSLNCHRATTILGFHGDMRPRRGALAMLCAAVILCSACTMHILQQTREIHPGSTQARVQVVLGAPQARQFRGAQEAWQYCETGVVQDTFVVVWFVEGTVTGMTTSKNAVGDIGFFCSSHLPPIRWEDAPTFRSEMQQH